MQVMPTPIRTVTLTIAFLGLGFYWLTFLAQPLVDGSSELNRALFVMSAVLYPEGYFLASWTDDGRLPLGILDRLPILAAALGWLGVATFVGLPFVKKVIRTEPMSTWLVNISFACLCGLALLSTLTLLVGLAGGLKAAWLGACVVLLVFASGCLTRIPLFDPMPGYLPNEPVAENDQRQSIYQRILTTGVIAATIWLGIAIMLGACLPPTEFDVVEYHLQAPKEFVQAKHIGFVPHNIYINMPLGAEMHSLAAMTLLPRSDLWLGGMIGKAITAAISIVGALLLGGWVAQRMDTFSGWTAAGIWLGTPGITHVAALGLIDGVLATYVLATALAVVQLKDRRSKDSKIDFASVLLPCLLGGAAAALKYPGLIYATLPCLLGIGYECFRLIRQKRSNQAVRLAMIATLALSVTCVPWYAKNWLLAGNPVYPLAAKIFGGRTLTDEKIAQWQSAHRVPGAPADAPLPKQLMGQAQSFGRDILRLTMTSSFVQPAMIIGVACAIIWMVRSSRKRLSRQHASTLGDSMRGDSISGLAILAVWSIWILLVWWCATHRIDRFWLPITGLWSALAAWGLWQARQRSLALAQTMLVPGLFYAVLVCSSPVVADNRFFVSLAALREDLGANPDSPLLPPIQVWINQHLKAHETRVLMIGEARVFPYEVDVVYSTCFDSNPGEAWLADKDAEQQRTALNAAGITHLLINWTEIQRYRSPGNYGFSSWPQPSHIEQLVADKILKPIEWTNAQTGTQLFEVVKK